MAKRPLTDIAIMEASPCTDYKILPDETSGSLILAAFYELLVATASSHGDSPQ